MRLIQINLNHCRFAQYLLAQTIYESAVAIAIISEPYRNLDGGVWVTDSTGGAVIWACGRQAVQYSMDHAASGFLWAKISSIFVYSRYARPSLTLPEFEDMLDDLVHDARGRGPKVIAGDFNAWAIDWRNKETNARGGAY